MPAGQTPFRPRRRWGQNFLVNTGACEAILRAFAPRNTDRVLEIGPGKGALTKRLAGQVARLAAVEVDPVLASALRQEFEAAPEGAPTILNADILEVDLETIWQALGADGNAPARVIANLPYNIATAVILRLLTTPAPVQDLMLMVQLEVAERIASPPRRKSYGGLSVLCQTYATVESVLKLGPGSFRPRPKVDSEVIHLTRREPGGIASRDPVRFAAIVRRAFAHRRKTLLNNMAGSPALLLDRNGSPAGHAAIERTIGAAGLDPRCRAEEIPVAGFQALAEAFSSRGEAEGYNAARDHPRPE